MFTRGEIPHSLDIPTGLGKTAVMAIWLVARAAGASVPRRLVYVVDRRAVVDQATEVAVALRRLVDREEDLKTRLGLDAGCQLPISTLRGQHVDNREWLEDPASPAIVVGTVDMVGSRLLFEGYGVSRKMRPYHAGLLGTDTLVVLDEAHLVPPFETLLESIAQGSAEFGPRGGATHSPVPPFRLLPLSATGRRSSADSLRLTGEDRRHPVVAKRLDAQKHLSMKLLSSIDEDSTPMPTDQEANDKNLSLADAVAREAWNLSQADAQKARIIIFCDSRRVAEKTKIALEKIATGDKSSGGVAVTIETELFVGGRRVFEREQAKKRLSELGFIAGTEVPRDRLTFLFATSAAEVGVDLDADHMVCDLVAWERMVQRLGRVNRRGGDGRVATVVVIVEPEPRNVIELLRKKPDDRSKREASTVEQVERLRAVRGALDRLPSIGNVRDASPGALLALKESSETDPELNKLLDEATTPAPLQPALTRALLEAWSMTSLEKHTGRPAIDPWLRGWIDDDPPRTSVVWRTHVPIRSGPQEPTSKELEKFFEAAPPHASEVLETETFRVLEWIEARAKAMLKPTREGQGGAAQTLVHAREAVVAYVLSRAGDLRRTLLIDDLLNDGDASARKEWKDGLLAALGGATVIVDVRLAGLKDGLLDEREASPPRTVDDGQEWLGEHVAGFRVRRADADETVVADPIWRERLRFASDVSEEGEPRRWLIIEKWRHNAATEEDRSSARPQLLDDHQSWAAERARNLALRLTLDPQFVEMLATATRLHDEGKRARRWQRAFNASADGIYAKTKGPINYALLDGYRHELGSLPRAASDVRLAELSEDLRELALHLIAAHHGFARPVIGTRGCEDVPPSHVAERARDVALRFARLQRRWGPWGLAWWEALLRAADQQASRDNDAVELVQQAEAV